jgi:hypothetical protein
LPTRAGAEISNRLRLLSIYQRKHASIHGKSTGTQVKKGNLNFKVSYKTIRSRGRSRSRKKYFWLRNTAEAAYDHVKSYRKSDVQVNVQVNVQSMRGRRWETSTNHNEENTQEGFSLVSIFKIGK